MTSQTIVLATAALLSTAPSAQAYVSPSVVPQHRPLRRQAPPSPTALSYLDDIEKSAHKNIWQQAQTIKRHDRQQYFDFIAKGAGAASPDPSAASPLSDLPLEHLGLASSATIHEALRSAQAQGEVRPPLGSRLLSPLSSVASLLKEAQTVAEEDRQAYFDFVAGQDLGLVEAEVDVQP